MPTVRTRILEAFKAHLEAATPPDRPFTIRHWRFRDPTEEELPCISIRYVSRDFPGVSTAADPAAAQLSVSEELLEIGVDLICDTPLPTEGSDADPTGLETPGLMLQACMDTLFEPGEQPVTLGGLLHDIRWDADSPGDDAEVSSPDVARLAERLTLVYRARTEYPIGILEG